MCLCASCARYELQQGGGVGGGGEGGRTDEYGKVSLSNDDEVIVEELCESRGGRPGLSVLTGLLVSVDVKQY